MRKPGAMCLAFHHGAQMNHVQSVSAIETRLEGPICLFMLFFISNFVFIGFTDFICFLLLFAWGHSLTSGMLLPGGPLRTWPCFFPLFFFSLIAHFSLLFFSSSFFVFFLWLGLCALPAEVEAATSPTGCLSLLLCSLVLLPWPHAPHGLQGCYSHCCWECFGDLGEEASTWSQQGCKAGGHQSAQGRLVYCPPQELYSFRTLKIKLNKHLKQNKDPFFITLKSKKL